jgi:hypothetical protein
MIAVPRAGTSIHAGISACYEEALAAAVEASENTPRLRPELARAQLLYGEWLRRDGRRKDARQQLRRAHESCVTIGMEAFAERAQGELLATGERVHTRTAETRDELTPQERQIARLARVFAKLGIRSRHELADALPVSDSEFVLA